MLWITQNVVEIMPKWRISQQNSLLLPYRCRLLGLRYTPLLRPNSQALEDQRVAEFPKKTLEDWTNAASTSDLKASESVMPTPDGTEGIPAKARFRHYLNLDVMESRIETLCRDFSWDRMDKVFLNN